ncbi:MAG: OmpA family protein [Bacteroidota bacterium]
MIRDRNKNLNKTSGSADRYLITYADLITLLLGLFVILYATSQVDQEKFKTFRAALSEYFSSGNVLEGGDGILEGRRSGVPEPILPPGATKELSDIRAEALEALKAYVDQELIGIQRTGSGLVLTLPEKLLFNSARAAVLPEGEEALDSLAGVLRGIPNQIVIDGHTDNRPISSFQYESNWHLSGARAINVLYELKQRGVDESNMSFRGFGSQKPIASNSTGEGRAKNRRVEITISEAAANGPSKKGYTDLDTNVR